MIQVDALNAILHARVRDSEPSRQPRNKEEFEELRAERLAQLRRLLGLEPEPIRPDLNLQVLRRNERDGFIHEIWQYDSFDGIRAIAHGYFPMGSGPFPTVVQAHENFPHQTCEPWVQARGISLALAGFACFLVTPPGISTDTVAKDRADFGTQQDPSSMASMPWLSAYAFDLSRLADALAQRPEFATRSIGLAGDGHAGMAAHYAFALDTRFSALACLFNGGSHSISNPAANLASTIPNLGDFGDVAEVLSLRAPAPVFLASSAENRAALNDADKQTLNRLQPYYRLFRSESILRAEPFFGSGDVNRRVREALLAFFDQHLRSGNPATYLSESRPLTDGRLNPYPGWTENAESEAFRVFPGSSTQSFSQYLASLPKDGGAIPFDLEARLIPWGRYGRIELPKVGATIRLQDEGSGESPPDVITVPIQGIDFPTLFHIGRSYAEFLAQILHLSLPGAPDGWESAARGGDALTTMIASVKSLMGSRTDPPTHLEAKGPLSSQIATFLRWFRPELHVSASDSFDAWSRSQGRPELITPLSRYYAFPRPSKTMPDPEAHAPTPCDPDSPSKAESDPSSYSSQPDTPEKTAEGT